ncbi:MAG: hypothetical protein M1831_006334 [Alyxoria varia]|nr:MAG: hypothetical protein M1831_006334 [Alyxoria varia]
MTMDSATFENETDLGPVIGKPEPSFLGLPLEIREKIYCYWIYAVELPDRMLHYLKGPPFTIHRRMVPDEKPGYDPLNLFLVNHQIYGEAQRGFWPYFRFRLSGLNVALVVFRSLHMGFRSQIRYFGHKLSPETANLHVVVSKVKEMRELLPNLRSVRFEAQMPSCPGKDVKIRAIQTLVPQIQPFWEVEGIEVECSEWVVFWDPYGRIPPYSLKDLGIVRIDSRHKFEADVGTAREQWEVQACRALRQAYKL